MGKADYLDPRWQKFRLEILQLADWRCQNCRDSKSTLNVHHRFYISGRKPWEYLQETMMVLCRECHEIAHEFSSDFETLGAEKWEKLLDEAFLHDKCVGEGLDDIRLAIAEMDVPFIVK